MSLPIDVKYVRLVSPRLRNFKQKDTYLFNSSCILCGDSKKNKTKARLYFYEKHNGILVRCHNCGASMSLGSFLKEVDTLLYDEYIMERYKSGESGYKPPQFNIPIPKFGKVPKQKVFEHAEWCDKLPEEHFCLTYLESRKIPKEHYCRLLYTSHYKDFCDVLVPNHGKEIVNDARLVIPYYSEYNELVAVSGRALETNDKTLRYVTLRTNDDTQKLIYGMERVELNKTVTIVEGPIDSLFLTNCVASGDANLAIAAKKVNASKMVLCGDREPRNREVCGLIEKAIKSGYYVVIWPDNLTFKDINEAIVQGYSPAEIESIISNNTFSGLEAELKFAYWNKV